MYYIDLGYIGEDCIKTNVAAQWKYHTHCHRQPSYVRTHFKNVIILK